MTVSGQHVVAAQRRRRRSGLCQLVSPLAVLRGLPGAPCLISKVAAMAARCADALPRVVGLAALGTCNNGASSVRGKLKLKRRRAPAPPRSLKHDFGLIFWHVQHPPNSAARRQHPFATNLGGATRARMCRCVCVAVSGAGVPVALPVPQRATASEAGLTSNAWKGGQEARHNRSGEYR